jgi:hypothetical protein
MFWRFFYFFFLATYSAACLLAKPFTCTPARSASDGLPCAGRHLWRCSHASAPP